MLQNMAKKSGVAGRGSLSWTQCASFGHSFLLNWNREATPKAEHSSCDHNRTSTGKKAKSGWVHDEETQSLTVHGNPCLGACLWASCCVRKMPRLHLTKSLKMDLLHTQPNPTSIIRDSCIAFQMLRAKKIKNNILREWKQEGPKAPMKIFILPYHQLPNNPRRVQFYKDAETQLQRSHDKFEPKGSNQVFFFYSCFFESGKNNTILRKKSDWEKAKGDTEAVFVSTAISRWETHPSGCCKTETINSTARAPAIMASPGRLTVHCWSKVRSLVDCGETVMDMNAKICSTQGELSGAYNSSMIKLYHTARCSLLAEISQPHIIPCLASTKKNKIDLLGN